MRISPKHSPRRRTILPTAATRNEDSTGRACESCHGPGAKHAESAVAADIRNPAKLAAAAIDKICLTCHLNQPTHIGRLASSHAKDQVACTTCHKIHAHRSATTWWSRKTAEINELCESCHLTVSGAVRAAFSIIECRRRR